MTLALYGKSISRVFYPEDSQGMAVQLPSAVPAIYLFDAEPSYDAATAGTGALQSITSWTQSATAPYGCSYEFEAVEDPQPGSNVPSYGYWEAINFIAETGGASQLVKRYFEVSRFQAPAQRPGTTIADLEAVYPNISTYATSEDLTAALTVAEEALRIDLEAKGIPWAGIANTSGLKLALAFKTLEMSCLALIKDPGDRHAYRAEAFKAQYKDQLAKVILVYDIDGDTVPDATRTAQPTHWVISGR